MKKFTLILPLLLVAVFTFSGCSEKKKEGDSDKGKSKATSKTDDKKADDKKADEDKKAATAAAKDIVDTAAGAENFKTLVAAVTAAGLVDTLKGAGPFTVFAPTDEAFAKLPEGTLDSLLKPENKDKLVGILTYHVVPGKVMAADVVKLTSGKTVQGGEVTIAVDGGAVKVDGANVTTTDIECSNGVIHVIDAVILPKE